MTVGILPLYLFFDPSTECCDNCPDNVFLIERQPDRSWTSSSVAINLIGVVLVALVLRSLVRRWRARHARGAPALRADVRGGRRADDRADRPARRCSRPGIGRAQPSTSAFVISRDPVRARAVPVPRLAGARAPASRAARSTSLMTRLSEAPRGGPAARRARRRARGPLARARLLAAGATGATWTSAGATTSCPTDDPSARDPHGRARRRVRGGDHLRRHASRRREPHVEAVGAAASLALDERAARRGAAREGRRAAPLARADAPHRRSRSAAGSSATCTTAPSSGSCRWRSTSGIARAKLNEDPLAADQLLRDRRPGARLRARGAARAGARHPPGRAHRPRARHGARDAREPRAGAGRAGRAARTSGCPRRWSWPPTSWWPRALTNVAKYAKATHATVRRRARERARWSWRWPTTGSAARTRTSGTGLRGLADRLAVLEGRLEIDSERGRGTTLRAQIPCA